MKIKQIKDYLKKLCKARPCLFDYILYDSQDNLIKINNGEWQNNNQNEITHDWDNSFIIIAGNNTINEVFVNGRLAELHHSNGCWYAKYPNLQGYMNNDDIFYILIKR